MSDLAKFERFLRSSVMRAPTADGSDLIVVAADSNRPVPAQMATAIAGCATKFAKDDLDSKILIHASRILAKRAEVFEFGDLEDAIVRENAKRAGPLLGKGMLSTPFEACLFWYSLIPDPVRAREQLQAIHADEDSIREAGTVVRRYCSAAIRVIGPGHGQPGHECGVQTFVVADFIRLLPDEVDALRIPRIASTYFTVDAIGVVNTRTDGGWEGRLLDALSERLPAYTGADESTRAMMRQMSLGSLADGVASAAMMLTTRGIVTRTEEASAKLNAKRIRNGKPPLVRVTVVDSRAYAAARERASLGGSHASPVPHLRRGHVRRLRSGRETWVRDMLVNCRSLNEVPARDHYEVKREKVE